jgi:carbamoyltransferase
VKILCCHAGLHDSAAAVFDEYRLLAAVQQERLTRIKADGRGVPHACIDECLAVTGLTRSDIDVVAVTRGALPWRYYTHFTGGRLVEGKVRQWVGKEKLKSMALELRRYGRTRAEDVFDRPHFLADHGFRPDAELRFCNHHLCHALPSLFFTDWDDALLVTSDGGGDNVQYSHRVFRDGEVRTLYGGDECLLAPTRIDSLGLAYGYATQALGYRINRHEGKLTGLSAYGKPTLLGQLAAHFTLRENGQIEGDFESYPAMRRFIFQLADGVPPEDVAASIQQLLEDLTLGSVRRLLEMHPVRHLGLSGGVFANVRLNRLLAEHTGVDEVFIFPAMGDEGLAVGGALQVLYERDGPGPWLHERYRLDDLYLGAGYDGDIDATLAASPPVGKISDSPVDETVALLASGSIGALYTGRMEFGPRALGARSILASPTDRSINATLNERLQRTEFMPFAPVVAEEDAHEVFEIGPLNRYAGRFMTITCAVRDDWRERIPAVIHVDGTARPQIIARRQNPLYFDILMGFKARTGLPVLINTSFNVHEEPIVNRPEECLRALLDRRIDFVVTRQAVYSLA